MTQEQINRLAEAIVNDVAWYEDDLTVDDVADDIQNRPQEVIKYLVDRYIGEKGQSELDLARDDAWDEVLCEG